MTIWDKLFGFIDFIDSNSMGAAAQYVSQQEHMDKKYEDIFKSVKVGDTVSWDLPPRTPPQSRDQNVIEGEFSVIDGNQKYLEKQ